MDWKINKILILSERVRSRDLLDLDILLNNGDLVFLDIINAYDEFKPEFGISRVKQILTGEIPLDKEDEGVEVKIEDIYATFEKRISEHESTEAGNLVSVKIKALSGEALSERLKGIAKGKSVKDDLKMTFESLQRQKELDREEFYRQPREFFDERLERARKRPRRKFIFLAGSE